MAGALATIQNKKTKYLEALSLKQKGYSIASISKQLNIQESEVLTVLADNDYSNKHSLSKIRSAEMAATIAAYDDIIFNMAGVMRTSGVEFREILEATKVMQTAIAAKAKLLGIDTFVNEKLAEEEVVELDNTLNFDKLTPEELKLYVELIDKMKT